jgi:hypothetical protein
MRSSELGALIGGCTHERYCRIVNGDIAADELCRYRVTRTKVDHGQRSKGNDLRHAETPCGLGPLRAGGQNASDEGHLAQAQ